MIDLDALVSLRAVDRHGSVIAASEMLGYTPSAVSQQVKRLERQVGVPLLERVGRGVMLTGPGGAGRRRQPAARPTSSVEAGLHRTRAAWPATSGSPPSRPRSAAWSPRPSAPPRRAPRAVLTVSEREPWDTVDLVAAGHVDVGWCTAGATCPSPCPST